MTNTDKQCSNSTTDVVEPYNGWVLRKVYFEDGEPLMHSEPESQELAELDKLVQAAEREAIMDEWWVCVQSDLEHGVPSLNDLAAHVWKKEYPAIAGFAAKINARGDEQSAWVGLTDEEILAITFNAKITEPNDEPIKFGAPSRKCIQDLVSCVEAKLKEKNNG